MENKILNGKQKNRYYIYNGMAKTSDQSNRISTETDTNHRRATKNGITQCTELIQIMFVIYKKTYNSYYISSIVSDRPC